MTPELAKVLIVPVALAIIGGAVTLLKSRADRKGAGSAKPPTFQETWDEARKLRADLDAADARHDAIRNELRALRDEIAEVRRDARTSADELAEKHTAERREDHRRMLILVDGVVAMWAYIQVLCAELVKAGAPVPKPSDAILSTMDAARSVANDTP